MDGSVDNEAEAWAPESKIADVCGIPVKELILSAGDTALDNSLQRILHELDRPQEVSATFSNAVG
jgi:hypothetical protein